MRHAVHVCLVSHQPTPNLTPVLDPRTRPEEVVLLTSEPMRERADWLENVLRPRGVRVARAPLDGAFDIERIREQVFDLVAAREGEDLALNATGGTKPMSIAAFEVFRGLGLPVFYVHPDHDRLVWLYHPAGDRPSAVDLDDRVKLPAFLAAHGVEMQSTSAGDGVPAPLRDLTRELVARPDRYGRALGFLNHLAASARGSLRSEPFRGGRGVFGELLELFEAAGCLRRESGRLRFPDETRRFYVNGGWLEAHVYSTIFGLRAELPEIHDLQASLEVTYGGEVRNEVDVAFLADNRLYVVECKTKRFSKSDGFADEALYKLGTLDEQLGGLGARSLLVSYQPIRRSDYTRARQYGIRTCVGAELSRLDECLREMVR